MWWSLNHEQKSIYCCSPYAKDYKEGSRWEGEQTRNDCKSYARGTKYSVIPHSMTKYNSSLYTITIAQCSM